MSAGSFPGGGESAAVTDRCYNRVKSGAPPGPGQNRVEFGGGIVNIRDP